MKMATVLTVQELIDELTKMPNLLAKVEIEGCDGCWGLAGYVSATGDNSVLIELV